jgi:hypothetical protein
MASHLYVSFWDLCLGNLPEGRLEHRVIGASEGSAMIRGTRTEQSVRLRTPLRSSGWD